MKLTNAFMFNNELDLLDIRLNELAGTIDEFILIESRKNHRNEDKPLYYEENKSRFNNFSSIVKHVIIDNFGQYNNSWIIEHHQRNLISNYCSLSSDEIVIVEDADEITRKESISWLKNSKIKSEGYNNNFNPRVVLTSYSKHPFKINNRINGKNDMWIGGFLVHANRFLLYTPQFFRNLRYSSNNIYFKTPEKINDNTSIIAINEYSCVLISNKYKFTGWHFSSLGTKEQIIEKLNSCVHGSKTENDTKILNNIELSEKTVNKKSISEITLQDLADGYFDTNKLFDFIVKENVNDDFYPKYIRENQNKFKNILL